MDVLLFIYDFYPAWLIKLLCLAVAALMVLTIHAYMTMANARLAAAKAGKVTADTYKATTNEPDEVAVFARAVANLFEMPVMFYALVIMSLTVGTASWITVILAWAYVILRFIHFKELTSSNDVLRRRKIFFYSTYAFMALLAEFVIALLFSSLV
ncbi:MAG: MAPEG family protein [Ahrensia sp.]|nr:MAPEG family protein [Ahrensia sp.]